VKFRLRLKSVLDWFFTPREVTVRPALGVAAFLGFIILLILASPLNNITHILERETIVVVTPTPGPVLSQYEIGTPSPESTPVGSGGILAFTMRHNGNSDIYLLSQNDGELLRLTSHPDADRDPVWSPDGQYLAFSSHRSNGWDLYVMDMSSGTVLRVTRSPGFEGAPSWSPDGRWLAYEGYVGDNLDIYIVNVEEGTSQRLTQDPAPEYSPAWSPDGRNIVFTSYRDENKDLYVITLDDGSIYNLTHTPNQDEDYAAWSPEGTYLAYSAGIPGDETIWRIPFDIDAAARGQLRPILFGVGGQPTWSPDGNALAFIFQQQTTSYLIAANTKGWALAQEGYSSTDQISDVDWSMHDLPAQIEQRLRNQPQELDPPLYTELLLSDTTGAYELVNLPDVNNSNSAEKLSDKVNDSYNALRSAITDATQWDYLSILGDSWRPMNHTPRPGQGRISWHVCGRAVDFNQEFLNAGQLELIREDIGGVTYWRVFIKAKDQTGVLGEPLRTAPWNLSARSKGGVAYVQGGELKEIPAGYYIDFTTIAADYGWERRNALSNWRTSFFDVEWWHFQKTEGMSWYDCMLELYPKSEIEDSYGVLPWWTKLPEWEVQNLP
jgi:TolB protein